jgi:hypothetical protein
VLKGNERHSDFVYPDNEWTYYLLADRFGWTPDQVDQQPARLVSMLLAIGNVVDEVKAEKYDN